MQEATEGMQSMFETVPPDLEAVRFALNQLHSSYDERADVAEYLRRPRVRSR